MSSVVFFGGVGEVCEGRKAPYLRENIISRRAEFPVGWIGQRLPVNIPHDGVGELEGVLLRIGLLRYHDNPAHHAPQLAGFRAIVPPLPTFAETQAI